MRRPIPLLLLLLLTTLAVPRAFGQSEVEEPELGRLPESFDMALDSLLNARYKEYYSLSKPHRQASKRELESKDQLYRDRLAQMESAIPLTYNPAVREAIDLYVNRRSNLMSLMLSRATYYFPIIEEELDRQGLPLELKYLAIVESALNPTAVSRMGATGFWQFMLRTGKIYGLTINSVVDERMDPRKSTRAMCEYFKDMYALYGDWMLAIAAYNCGPGNINKAIRRSGGKRDFWEIFPYLPRETRSYVPFFIAAFYSMEYYREHDIRPSAIHIPIATDTVHLARRCTTRELAEITSVSLDTIELLNPMYKKGIIPGNQQSQVIVLPAQAAIDFASNKEKYFASHHKSEAKEKDSAPDIDEEQAADSEREVTYRVRRGDSLGSIARRYHVTTAQIKEWNGLRSNTIHPGQKLVIRTGAKASVSAAKSGTSSKKSKSRQQGARYYTVKRGDTLSGIALKYKGVTVTQIKRANNLRSNNIRPGQRLVIP